MRSVIAVVLGLCVSAAVAQGASQHAGQSAAVPTKPTIAEKIAANKLLLDINTATPEQLRALPGMGDNYVKRIIDGRPYSAKNQLVSRGVLPKAAYEAIKDQIVAHRPKP